MIIIFRYGHRIVRDKRLTTHCGLIAHAFNADSFVLNGEKDSVLLDNLNKMVLKCGDKLEFSYEQNAETYLKEKKNQGFKIIHLTMYGEDFKENMKNYRKNENLVIVIGSQKVPPEVYNLADYNVSIGNLPHSEAAALAVFLYEYFEHTLKKTNLSNKKIIPNRHGKLVKS